MDSLPAQSHKGVVHYETVCFRLLAILEVLLGLFGQKLVLVTSLVELLKMFAKTDCLLTNRFCITYEAAIMQFCDLLLTHVYSAGICKELKQAVRP